MGGGERRCGYQLRQAGEKCARGSGFASFCGECVDSPLMTIRSVMKSAFFYFSHLLPFVLVDSLRNDMK